MGVESIRDIPDDFELTEIQRRAATCVQTGEPWFRQRRTQDGVGESEVSHLYIDFESVNPAIPRFAGMRPYQQMPFQLSVHVAAEPSAEPEHREFLARDRAIPGASSSRRCAMRSAKAAASLCTTQHLNRSGSRNRGMAAQSSRSASRTYRLGCGICFLSFGTTSTIQRSAGRTRLKTVLPALVPEHDLRRHGRCGWAGRWAGLGIARAGWAWISPSCEQHQEGSAGILRAGHAGAGQAVELSTATGNRSSEPLLRHYRGNIELSQN